MARRRGISDDDRRIWQQVTETVTPLHETLFAPAQDGSPQHAPDTTAAKARVTAQPAPAGLPQLGFTPDAIVSASLSGAAIPRSLPALPPDVLQVGALHMMDRRTAERLKGGRMIIAARIDLHGMPAVAAQAAFERFIISSHARGHRCVLVITGKGQRSGTDGGVLKRELPRWLNLPQIRPLVLATTPAQPKDGGAGAMYVLLRRERL